MEDIEIIKDVLEGDQQRYALIVRKYQSRIFSLCVSMLSDASLAEDAAQEIFVKAYRSLSRFQGHSSFYTWLYRIASNHCLDLLRKKSRNKTQSWEALVEEKGEQIHELLTASGKEEASAESSELIQRVLSCLSPEYRLILVMREIEGLSYQEIAASLHCSLDAVKARLRRAREDFERKLRHFWESENVK